MDPFRERNYRFLIASFPAVDVDDRLVCLRSEYMRSTDGKAIGGCGGALEGLLKAGSWLKGVDVDSGVLRGGGYRALAWGERRRYKGFC